MIRLLDARRCCLVAALLFPTYSTASAESVYLPNKSACILTDDPETERVETGLEIVEGPHLLVAEATAQRCLSCAGKFTECKKQYLACAERRAEDAGNNSSSWGSAKWAIWGGAVALSFALGVIVGQ